MWRGLFAHAMLSGCLKNIVAKLQNNNAYAEPCRISYTVAGKAAFYSFEV
ncbi:MAG: hypothetical protein IKZ88_03885 [Neisseriaceae bacterium]|nr:hypothetical protein [Neisseriaceae bacterium]